MEAGDTHIVTNSFSFKLPLDLHAASTIMMEWLSGPHRPVVAELPSKDTWLKRATLMSGESYGSAHWRYPLCGGCTRRYLRRLSDSAPGSVDEAATIRIGLRAEGCGPHPHLAGKLTNLLVTPGGWYKGFHY